MFLVDTEGRVHHDEENVSEHMLKCLTSPANDYSRLVLLEEYGILYRYDPKGDLDMFFIGNKPFRKLHLTLFQMHTYQDAGELFTEDCRVSKLGDKEVSIMIGREIFTAPESLLTLW